MAYTRPNTPVIEIQDAQIFGKNFQGKKGDYNDEGERSFCLYVDQTPGLADALKADGWNVKMYKPKTAPDEDPARPMLRVIVKFGQIPPKIVLVSSSGVQTFLKEEEMPMIDASRICEIDMVVSPYHWEHRGERGTSAYLKTMYFKLEHEEFGGKYAARTIGDNKTPW